MRRADVLIALALVVFAGFIGAEMFGMRGESRGVAPPEIVAVQPGSSQPTSPNEVVVPSGGPPAPVRNVEEIRRQLREREHGTYVGDILAARDSNIARWADRRADPVRVWISERPPLTDFDPSFPSEVRRAFADWGAAGVPLAFSFIPDSARAEVHVTFVDHFEALMAGRTLWERDPNWWIVGGDIQLSLRGGSGGLLTPPQLYAIAVHEVGHLLGLDHTRDTTSIMATLVRTLTLGPRDVATMRLIYQLPPGSVKAPR